MMLHWVGDYYLQWSDMAKNKHNNNAWLTLHVSFYGIPLILGSIFLAIFSSEVEIWEALLFAVVNIALHWVTDYFTSRLAEKYRGRDQYYWVTGADQFIHITTLLTTSHFIFNL